MQRPSTSQGGRSVVTDAETAYCARRPNTATVPGRDRSTFSSSFQLADSLNSDKLEYRKRLDEWRQMSAPELGDARLSQADFLRFARPGQLTGIRDKLKLETLSRAYGVARATSHRPQLSPVRNKRLSTCTGTTPGQPFIEEPVEVTNCDEVIISWKPPMNSGGGNLVAFRIKYSATVIKGVSRTTPPADDMVIVQTITDPEARRASIRGLLPGTTYSFRMVCQSTYGWGKPGRGVYATTLSHPVPRFVAGERQKHALELAWSVPGGFIDVTEVQIELWQYSQSNVPGDEEEDEGGGGAAKSQLESPRALSTASKSRHINSERSDSRLRPAQGEASTAGLQQRAGSSRCITIDAQRHDHCTLKDLSPGTIYAIRGRSIRRAPSHYDERDPRYAALLEAGLVDLGRASHTCPWSHPIKARTVPDVPAVPKVKVVRPGSVSVTLEWREPRDNGEPITSYDVQVCDAMQEQDDEWVSKSVAGSRLYTSFSDLPSFTSHRVRVRAINEIGSSEFSSAFAFQTLPSESVPDLVLMRDDPAAATMVSVTMRWDRPLEVPGCPLDGYEMEYQVSRLQAGTMIDTQEWVQLTHPPRATSFTLEDLNPGNMVQFRMRALNVNGTGPWSDVVECKTGADVPATPHIAASKVGSTIVTVYWKTPLENGSDIESYQLEYALASDPSKWLKVENAEPGAKTIPAPKRSKASALSKLRATAKDIGAASDAGAALEAENMHEMDGLFSFETHTVRVRALNGQGFSEWSTLHTFTTDPSDNIPGTMHLDGGDLCADGVSRATEESLTFIFEPPTEIAGVILQRYQLEYRMKPRIEGEEPAKWSLKVLKYSDHDWTLQPLEPGQWVEARIRAKNANGFGHWSANALVQSVPIPPEPPRIDTAETKALPTSQSGTHEEPREPTHETLLFWMPAWNNGAEVSEFDIHVTIVSGEQRADGPYTPYKIVGPLGDYGKTPASHNIEGLLPFEDHHVRVRGKNRKGWGAWSNPFSFKTKPSLARPPKMVLSVAKALGPAKGDVAGDITNDGVVVRWERPPEVPGVELLGFRLEHRETGGVELNSANGGDWIITELPPYEKQFKIELLPGMGIDARVAGVNVNGTGNMSEEIVSAALPKAPDPPVDPKYSEVEDTSVLCRWTKPDVNGASILEYEVVPMPLVDASEAKVVPSAKLIHPLYTHARMGQLEEFSEYCLAVRARNVAGWSKASIVNVKTAGSSSKPGFCTLIGDPYSACDDSYSASAEWEPPQNLPGVLVDKFEIHFRRHDPVGSEHHRTELKEIKQRASSTAGEIFMALAQGDPWTVLGKLISASNDMVIEIEKAFGRQHSEGLMAAICRRATGGLRGLFAQLVKASRSMNSAPVESLAEKQAALFREAVNLRSGETQISDLENVCQLLIVSSRPQIHAICKAFVKTYGYSPHEMLESAAASSSEPSDKEFAKAVLEFIFPQEVMVTPPYMKVVQDLEQIFTGGAVHELSIIATRSTQDIHDMVALYRRRYGSSLVERAKKKASGNIGVQKLVSMLLEQNRLEDCPVVDAAVADDVQFLKHAVDSNIVSLDGDHRSRLLEIATIRPHSHLAAVQAAYGADLGVTLAGDDFCTALGACLAAVLQPTVELTPEEPEQPISENGWEIETSVKTQWKLEKLKPGTPVDVMIRAHNINGFGRWTGPFLSRSYAKEPDVPIISSVENQHDGATITWETVPCNGSMVTHFDIDIDGARTEQVMFDVPAHPDLPSAVISGLRPNTDYAVRVRAHNEIGSSAWSSAERVRTALSPAVLDIQTACFPEKGASKDPYRVFKTLWALTNEQIGVTRDVYHEKFGQDLRDVLQKLTSGPFQLTTLMLLDKLRVEFGQLSVRIDGGFKLYKTQTSTPLNPFLKLAMKKVDPLRGTDAFAVEAADAESRPAVEQKLTRVVMGGNTSPKWNQDLVFDIDCYQKSLSLVCYHEDLIDGNEVIGMVEVDLAEALDRQGETVERTVILQDENVANRGEIRLGLRFEGLREQDAHCDKEAEEWRKATKIKLGTDFEACTKVLLGNNRAQLLRICERYVTAFECTPHDDLRGESFLKPTTKMWAKAILELILPNEAEGGGIDSRWGAGPISK